MTGASKRISRRRIVATSAWAAPAAVVATSVPAFAATTGANALVFTPGTSGVTQNGPPGVTYYDFQFIGAEVHVDGQPDPGAVLFLGLRC